MNLVVLLAGIADPKKPLPRPASGNWRDLASAPDFTWKLSPFDEAALEIALKLRLAVPDTVLTACVTDGCGDDALLRAIAAFRPDDILRVARAPITRWDPVAMTQGIGAALATLPAPPDLVLIGREHGDGDDGALPPFLAQALGYAYAGLALEVRWQDGRAACTRSSAGGNETVMLPAPALVSISNDKGNRLRHPLLKNVLHAKQWKFGEPLGGTIDQAGSTPASASTSTSTPASASASASLSASASASAPTLALAEAEPTPTMVSGNAPCRILTGSMPEQAGELARYLRAAVVDTHQTESRIP